VNKEMGSVHWESLLIVAIVRLWQRDGPASGRLDSLSNTCVTSQFATFERPNEKKCLSHRGRGLPGLFTSGKVFGVVEMIHSAISGWWLGGTRVE